jgi:hypothetical protein
MAGSSSIGWMVAAIALGVVAVGVGGFAYVEQSKLSAQLATATDDASRAHSEAATLKAQLDAANQQLASYGRQIRADEDQLVKAEHQIGTDEQRIAAESRPDLPIKLSFRQALTSQGEVAMMQNVSGRTLQFVIDVQSPTGQHFRRPLVIDGGRTVQLGAHEGWTFAPGQMVTLSSPSFRPVVMPVPG